MLYNQYHIFPEQELGQIAYFRNEGKTMGGLVTPFSAAKLATTGDISLTYTSP